MTAAERPRVLIAGAGPTGLTLAWALRRHGVALDIVDVKLGIAPDSKALALNHLSQYAFAALGAPGEVGRTGCRIRRLNVNYRHQRLAAVDFRHLHGPIRSIITQPQSTTESELSELLRRSGCVVRRGVQLVEVRQNGESVEATLEDYQGRIEGRHYQYVVGCEGRHSVVRASMGAELDMTDYGAYMVLGDFELDGSLPRDQVHYHAFDDAFFVVVPTSESQSRVVGLFAGVAPDIDEAVLVLQRAANAKFGERFLRRGPFWRSRAQLCQASADRIRKERLFIAGDAAHLFAPLGGTGMNTGIADAFNLSWKLAYACRAGVDADRVLQSYEDERLPIIRQLAAATDFTLRLARERDARLAAPILPSLRNREQLRTILPMRYSGLGQRYAPSALLGGQAVDPSALLGSHCLEALCASRAARPKHERPTSLLDFVLFVHGPSLSPAVRQELTAWKSRGTTGLDVAFSNEFPSRAPFDSTRRGFSDRPRADEMVLVRPDGVVALHVSNSRLAPVARYLATFGVSTPADWLAAIPTNSAKPSAPLQRMARPGC